MKKKIALLLVFSLLFLLVGCLGGIGSDPKGTVKVTQPIDKNTEKKLTNATISFNGEQKSATGFSQKIETGTYKLKITKKNYEIWEQDVTIKENKETIIKPKLTLTEKEVGVGSDWQEPAQPSNLSALCAKDYIKLSWSIPEVEITGYKIYRSKTDQLPTKPVKVIEKEDLLKENNNYVWLDPTVKKQETYYYWLKAYNDKGVVSKLSNGTGGILVDIYSVTFDYQSSVSGLKAYLFSDINNWDKPIGQLGDDNNDNIYEFTTDLNSGEYKYLFYLRKWILPKGADKYVDDNVGGENAVAVVPDGESSYTFEYTPSVEGFKIYLASEISGWTDAIGESKWELTDSDGDGTYQIKVSVEPGEYQYKYVIRKFVRDDADADKYVDSDVGTVSAIVVGN